MIKEWKVKVKVTQVVDELSDHDDKKDQPEGEYDFEVSAHCEDDAGERALDEFSLTIPIGCLDDFDIDVVSVIQKK